MKDRDNAALTYRVEIKDLHVTGNNGKLEVGPKMNPIGPIFDSVPS